MHFSLSHVYEHDTDTVLNMFTDRRYLERKYHAMGPGPVEFIEFGEVQSRFRATIQRQLPGISDKDVPRIARRFVRDTYTLVYTVEWDLPGAEVKSGRMSMHIQDLPVEISGELRLLPTGQGCAKEFDIQINSGIPVIGSKVSSEAAKLVRRSLDKEYAFSQQYLRDHAETGS